MNEKTQTALVSVEETSKETGLGPRIIRKCVDDGTIPGQRFGRLIRIPRWWIDAQKKGVA